MRYVHVASMAENRPHGFALSPVVARQTGNCLYSLIEGLKQRDFGLETLERVAHNIRSYKGNYLQGSGRIFTDSGGYSIIKGDVPPELVRRFIKCYNAYVEHEVAVYDYVFSLDIPFSAAYSSMNTKQAIYEFNRESLMDTRELLERCPELRTKLYFVWHFKMPSQYEIWSRLYDEIGLKGFILNRAIGGMVGMRRVTKNLYSPFIGIAFKCLADYLESDSDGHPFRLHYLGMYSRQDRLQIALLEALFSEYLGGAAVEMTYDSINYAHSARMNKRQPVYQHAEGQLLTYPTLGDVPGQFLDSVYHDPVTIDFIQEQLERRSRGQRLTDINAFVPLSIESNIHLDRYFEALVRQENLVSQLRQASTPTVVEGFTRRVFEQESAKHPKLFTPALTKAVLENMNITHIFHRWFTGGRKTAKLQNLMATYIKMLGFPECLS